MTRVNVDTDRLTEFERSRRREIKDQQIEPSRGPDPSIYEVKGIPYSFVLKRPDFDAQGAIDAFWYEEGTRQRYFYPFMKEGTVLYDVGSAYGHYSLPALALGARVFAFEPDPRYTQGLQEQVNLNGFQDRFEITEKAVADEDFRKIAFDELEDVPCVTLDSFFKKSRVKPTYIKIDVEGMEARVIQGMTKVLETKPRVFVENHLNIAVGAEVYIYTRMMELGYTFQPLRQRTSDMGWSFFEPLT